MDVGRLNKQTFHSLYREAFEFLAVRHELAEIPRCDLIIGFGHFDPKIPATCGDLFRLGVAPRILFTGGRGAGTADLNMAEAIFFLEQLQQTAPEIPRSSILLETESTNTSENLTFSDRILAKQTGVATFSKGIQRVVLVANAYRQLRVGLTLRLLYPGIEYFNFPPQTDYDEERRLFAGKEQNLDELLVGEIERLRDYPTRGFIAPCVIPEKIIAICSAKPDISPRNA